MDIYPAKDDKLLFEKRSGLQLIRAFDKLNGLRYMTLDGVVQGGVLPGRPSRLIMPYFKLAFASLIFIDEPAELLFVGLGCGAMPSFVREALPRAHADVVEIDPDVVEAAKAWFGFYEDGRVASHVGDGREFIRGAASRYDAVFLDAYRGVSVPAHLTTIEFMGQVKAALRPGGVAVMNVWGPVVNQRYYSSVRTLHAAFPQVYRFRSYTSNNIFVAGTKEARLGLAELLGRAKAAERAHELGFGLTEMLRRQYAADEPAPDSGEVLHDPAD